jgi:uncharacterized cupredoxin-like copper-binding protein
VTIHLAPPTGSGTTAPEPVTEGTPEPGPAVAAATGAGARREAPRSRWARRALVAAALVLVPGAVVAWLGTRQAGAATRTVVVTMHHSKFQPAAITVAPGTKVRFVLRNTDPIDHEFIIGSQAVHDLHERGTQRRHDGPGEVTVPAGEERSTTVSLNLTAPGQLEYACHLPGHYAYGMRGVVTVRR